MLKVWQKGSGSKMSSLKEVQGPTMFSKYTVCIFRGSVSFNEQVIPSLPNTNSRDGILNRFDYIISWRSECIAQGQTRLLEATGAAGNGEPILGVCPVYAGFCFKGKERVVEHSDAKTPYRKKKTILEC